ncbi:MAG: hypothetical protein HOY79_17710 [Streptomyces sp.]|nr:hypothetical protein [Streptomyces sp.]
MTTTIARQARIRFADQTAPLAQVIINARFAAIVADLITEIEDDLVEEFEFECQVCGDGVHEIFHRLTEDYEPVEACERCVDEYRLGYCAD